MSPTLIALIIQYGLQYGVPAVTEIISTLRKPNATIDDVEALFAKLKTYAEYQIPNLPK